LGHVEHRRRRPFRPNFIPFSQKRSVVPHGRHRRREFSSALGNGARPRGGTRNSPLRGRGGGGDSSKSGAYKKERKREGELLLGREDAPDERNHRTSSAGPAERRKRRGRDHLAGDLQLLYRSFATFPPGRTPARGEAGVTRGGFGRNDSVRPRCSLATLQITSCPASRIPNFGPRGSEGCLYLSGQTTRGKTTGKTFRPSPAGMAGGGGGGGRGEGRVRLLSRLKQ